MVTLLLPVAQREPYVAKSWQPREMRVIPKAMGLMRCFVHIMDLSIHPGAELAAAS
jgi:hypothetical protein